MRLRSPATAPGAGSDVRAMARGGAINMVGGVVGAVATFLLLAVLARLYGVTDTGLFFQSLGVVSTGAIVCSFGGPTAAMQRVAHGLARQEADLTALWWAAAGPVLLVSGACSLALMVFHTPVAHVLAASPSHREALAQLLLAMAPALVCTSVTRLLVAVSRGAGEMAPTAWYDAGGQPTLRLALCALAAAAGGPLWWSGAAVTLASFAGVAGAAPHAARSLRRRGAFVTRHVGSGAGATKGFWSFAAPRGLEEIFQATNVWLLVVIVGSLSTAAEATAYAAVSRFALGSTLLMQAITTGMAPRLTQAFARHEQARVSTLFTTAVRWTVGLSLPISITLWVFPTSLLHVVSPEIPDATFGVRVIAVATVFTMVTGPSGATILFAGRSRWNLWIALPSWALMLLLAVALVPGSGADGASLAWGSAIVLQSVLGYWVTKRAFGLDPVSRDATRLGLWSAGLTIVGEGLARLAWGDSLLGLVCGVAAGSVLLLAGNTLTRWRLWRGPALDAAVTES